MPKTRASADPMLLLDNQLCFALYSASLAMTKAYKPLLERIGLTYPQYLVMLTLWEKDGVMVSEIGERLTLDSGTLTPLLKRLEKGALITRLRDANDERRVRVKLTAAGARLKSDAADIVRCIAATVAIPAEEIGALTQQVKVLRARLVS